MEHPDRDMVPLEGRNGDSIQRKVTLGFLELKSVGWVRVNE